MLIVLQSGDEVEELLRVGCLELVYAEDVARGIVGAIGGIVAESPEIGILVLLVVFAALGQQVNKLCPGILIGLGILFLILIALLCDLIRKTERQNTEWNRMIQQLTSEQTEAAASAESVSPETINHPAPESEPSGGGL